MQKGQWDTNVKPWATMGTFGVESISESFNLVKCPHDGDNTWKEIRSHHASVAWSRTEQQLLIHLFPAQVFLALKPVYCRNEQSIYILFCNSKTNTQLLPGEVLTLSCGLFHKKIKNSKTFKGWRNMFKMRAKKSRFPSFGSTSKVLSNSQLPHIPFRDLPFALPAHMPIRTCQP